MSSVSQKNLTIKAVLLLSTNVCHPSGDHDAKKYKLEVETSSDIYKVQI
jgi:hypothetical protein